MDSVDVLDITVFLRQHLLAFSGGSYVLHQGLLPRCSNCLAQTSVLTGLFLLKDHGFYSLLHFLFDSLPHYFVPVHFSHRFSVRSGCFVDLG